MSNACQNSSKSFVLLSTAIGNAYDKDKNVVPCRVLLDSASQSNFVSTNMVSKLKLKTSKIDIPVNGINQIETKITRRVNISFSSQHTGYKNNLNFLELSKITECSPQSYLDISIFNIPHKLPLADSTFNIPAEIDMLLD